MKKEICSARPFIHLLFALSFVVNSFGQQDPEPAQLPQADYLKKSKNQRVAGWVLLSGGAALVSTGLVIGSNRAVDEIGAWFDGGHDSGYRTGAVLFYTGVGSMLASIPLFIASSRNKRKDLAASAFIKIENRAVLQAVTLVKTSYPAFGMRFPIR